MTGFWSGRRVLVTGQTGFKGAWLCLWLEKLGAKVTAFALPPQTEPSLYGLVSPWSDQTHHSVDLRDAKAVAAVVGEAKPEIIFHLAAQALVRPAYRDPLETYATNVMGTLHILLAARDTPGVEAVVVTTTDKVYENDSKGVAFSEVDRLGGKDPYSASKACAEIVTSSFRYSYLADGRRPAIATVRAGNVVGGGDWSEDRLVSDVVRAIGAGRKVELRYPNAVRPWQHVLEPLRGYMTVAERLVTDPASVPPALNFGPDPGNWLTVSQVADIMSVALGAGSGWEKAPGIQPPEAATLTLSSELAKRSLGWTPRLSMQDTVDWTADWYKAHRAGRDMKAVTLNQIARYETLTKEALAV
ncbi:MAG TPA: CDP-glucose 4,6-dehydratase [Pseudolabrys sp.]